jgi:outer membrane protein assembly factor BamA
VNIQMMAGLQLQSGIRHLTTLYVQQMQSQLLFVDTLKLKLTRKLPPELDIRTISFGLQYEGNTTNYRFNPLSGNEVQLNFSLGTRQVARNSVISQMKGSGGFLFSSLYDTIQLRSYQFRLRTTFSHYFRLGTNSTVKGSLQAGWVESPTLFRNELFQIGGYKLLRGFDEESIYASRFGVFTAEYRYLIALNSYLFAFADGGWSQNAALRPSPNYSYLGAGLGISLETQAGQFNISLAAGKRNDLEFNARQSRIHIGYINFF